jgi:hypothetical protein
VNGRGLGTLVPLVVLGFWIGVYPKPFLEFLHKPVANVAALVQPAKFGAAQPVHAATGEPAGGPATEPTPAPGH